MELNFLQAYAITLATETTILCFILKKEYGTKQIIKNSLVANTLTLPVVWFAFPILGLAYPAQITISEIFAFGAEAAVYRILFSNIKNEAAMIASLVCNLTSFVIGIMAMAFG